MKKNLAILIVAVFFLTHARCATLKEIAALRDVNFQIARLDNLRLAEVDLTGKRTYEDFTLLDITRLTSSFVEGEIPLQFDLELEAENPSDNRVDARLMALDWTLFLDETETISGSTNRQVILPPGEARVIPISMSLELLQFFQGSVRELLDMVLGLSQPTGQTTRIALRASPTVDTALGPIRYPRPITILRSDIPH